jgi:peptide/nickel transport system substrate-binding protein
MRPGRLSLAAPMILAVSLVGSTCSGGAKPSMTSPRPSQGVVKGGKIVLGAEDWPQCLNPITACASSRWSYWSVVQHVMPRATQLSLDGTFTNSPLTTEFPSLANGDLVPSPFTIKYRINPEAVWADGTAITCDDFEFTRNAIIDTRGALAKDGYDRITAIDCTDPHTAVLNFKDIYVDWPDLFGGAGGVVLEKAAFPMEKDRAKIDLSREMNSDIPCSGGPWKLQSWNKEQAVLVPNATYWGHKPNLDQVTFVPRNERITETNELLSGAVDAAFAQAGSMQIEANSAIRTRVGPGVYYDALWMNVSRFPFDDPRVREAFFWSVDREAILEKLFHISDPGQAPLGCGVLAIPGSFWCHQQPFARFHYDPDRVARILRRDGWAKDSSGFWAKGRRRLAFHYLIAGSDRQVATQGLLRQKMIAAGFKVTTVDPGSLPEDCLLLACGFQLADFAEGGSPDPSVTGLLACNAIPTDRNDYSGRNVSHWCNERATMLMKMSDSELDPSTRRELLDQLYQTEVHDFAPALPLYVLPNVIAWRADRIGGPVGEGTDQFGGGFFNIDEWYCIRPGACP